MAARLRELARRPGSAPAAALALGAAASLAASASAPPARAAPADSPPPPAAASASKPPSEPREPDLWDRWAQAKLFLSGWRRRAAALASGSPSDAAEPPLPTDKLRCALPSAAFPRQPVVLVACGSFDPPTHAHLRMLDLARAAMRERGADVWGSYLSPVGDAYWKRGLSRAAARLRMCQLAAETSDHIMADPWEARQKRYVRTLHALEAVERRLAAACAAGAPGAWRGELDTGTSPTPSKDDTQFAKQGCAAPARAVLVCGADVLASMADPAVWRPDLLEKLLAEHGLVAVARTGAGANCGGAAGAPTAAGSSSASTSATTSSSTSATSASAPSAASTPSAPSPRDLDDLEAILARASAGSPLRKHRDKILLIRDPVPNGVSSSAVRAEVAAARPVRYLLPDAVIAYAAAHGMYGNSERGG
jgi:nicotinamide mononucleotide adenylyltransferase